MHVSFDPKAYPILFVDDEPDLLDTFELNYAGEFTILTASSGREALAVVERVAVAVLVADQRMPELCGLDVIRGALERRPDVVPIILTGYTDLEVLVEALNLGRIHRYITKPWDSRELRLALTNAVEAYHLGQENTRLGAENARLVEELRRANERLAEENRFLKDREAAESGFGAIVAESEVMRQVLARARRVLDSDATVLLEGASGTGKELVARALHYEGPRRDRLFVPVNCGALTETLLEAELFGHRRGAFTGAAHDRKGLFEVAHGGTIFLDEVGDASPACQVQLLRVLQEGEIRPVGATRPVRVDVRVIAATNRDLRADVTAGWFREDLYFRLRVFPLRLPPLRERTGDVAVLVRHFLAAHALQMKRPIPSITPGAVAMLAAHDFPGNVRELENVVQRALLLAEPGEPIGEAHLLDAGIEEAPAARGGSLQDEIVRLERELVQRALALAGGNKTRAAEHLGLTYRGLLKKMQRLGMGTGGAREAS
ncbi:MAG: sigma-54 dependent transcriptional regulator [Candidatus Binatia bacterium]